HREHPSTARYRTRRTILYYTSARMTANHTAFAVLHSDGVPHIDGPGFKFPQKVLDGNVRRGLLAFRVVKLRAEGSDRLHFGIPIVGNVHNEIGRNEFTLDVMINC